MNPLIHQAGRWRLCDGSPNPPGQIRIAGLAEAARWPAEAQRVRLGSEPQIMS